MQHKYICYSYDIYSQAISLWRWHNTNISTYLEMLLEPLDQAIDTVMNFVPIPESIWCHCQVLDSGLGTRLVPNAELPRELFWSTEVVRDSLGVFGFLLPEQVLEFIHIASTGLLVALVEDQVSCKAGHGLHKPGQNLVQILVSLEGREERRGREKERRKRRLRTLHLSCQQQHPPHCLLKVSSPNWTCSACPAPWCQYAGRYSLLLSRSGLGSPCSVISTRQITTKMHSNWGYHLEVKKLMVSFTHLCTTQHTLLLGLKTASPCSIVESNLTVSSKLKFWKEGCVMTLLISPAMAQYAVITLHLACKHIS